ncbi:thioredoxin-like protein [Mycena rosella]|uniref:glutathione peroxidase n=1 Tax=Mycena rosella TaxID=1033263 RepID=A0AAD7DMJ1_MYCRO|nr:thioredoxin-like protein [Mycena rosella]
MLSSIFKFFTASPVSSEAAMATAKELVETAISENKIMIFSKSTCPYCRRAKALFAAQFPDEKPVVFELNEREDGADIQNYLAVKTGQRTVPNIFVNKKHVGGNDDTQAAFKTGQLAQLVKA